jgi:lysozyme
MTLFGPDGSRYQNGIRIPLADWGKVAFVIWRASIGTRTDVSYPWARLQADLFAKAFVAYHFVYPTRAYPAAAQAATFHTAVKDTRVPCMLDWESDGTLAATFDELVAVAEAIRAVGHRVPLVYTGRWYWQAKGSPRMTGYGFDLVNSHYGSNLVGELRAAYAARGGDQGLGWQGYGDVRRRNLAAAPFKIRAAGSIYASRGGDNGSGWNGYGGLTPVLWQYGSRVSFGNAAMDMNAYKGDPGGLHRWFYDPAYEDRPVPPPPSPPSPPSPGGPMSFNDFLIFKEP